MRGPDGVLVEVDAEPGPVAVEPDALPGLRIAPDDLPLAHLWLSLTGATEP